MTPVKRVEEIIEEFYSTFEGNKFEASYKRLKTLEDGSSAPYFMADWLRTTLTTFATTVKEDTLREIEIMVVKTGCEYGTAINRFMRTHDIAEESIAPHSESRDNV